MDLGAFVHGLPERALEGVQVAISCPFRPRVFHMQVGRISPGGPPENQAPRGLMGCRSGGLEILRRAAGFAGRGALAVVGRLSRGG